MQHRRARAEGGAFVILLVAFQLREGHRIGDGWAGTRVIWKEYRDRAPFTA